MDAYNQEFLSFLDEATDSFHATSALKKRLDKAGFIRLYREESWDLVSGKCYYLTDNDSALIAFKYHDHSDEGIRFVGAHTDSPCLKLKPTPISHHEGYLQLNVEVYGGMLLAPWFDRDLSLSGRVSYDSGQGKIKHTLLNIKRPIAIIPNLAIHLNREANKNRTINPQSELVPMIAMDEPGMSFDQWLMDELRAAEPTLRGEKILAHELSLYDTSPAQLIGLNREFISSARLDNLLSCFAGMHALMNATPTTTCVLVCHDHEEVGSGSSSGAKGPFLDNTLRRIYPDAEYRDKLLAQSTFVSADGAHAQHPNYANKHDMAHTPKLNHGPVIKMNHNQRYASNSETVAACRLMCENQGIPYQLFSSRNDIPCGSTIGPITASRLGIKTLDVGAPQFAMHSIREVTGAKDGWLLSQFLVHFYQNT